MKYEPLLYFAALHHIDNTFSYAIYDKELNNPFIGTYHFEAIEDADYIITIWYDFIEKDYYHNIISLSNLILKKSRDNTYIDICYLLGGGFILWIISHEKSQMFYDFSCEKIINIKSIESASKVNDWIIRKNRIQQQFDILSEGIKQNALVMKAYTKNLLQQFNYRYLPIFGKWDEGEEKWSGYDENETKPEFDYIEEALYDGTHDKLHDGGLMKYHMAGKPKKMAVKWHKGKSEYSAYFWFENEKIRSIYDRFYGAHPDTKADFMIHIDSENKKYTLSLFRYGLQEPLVIPESAYQLIVFRNRFESFRSDNYNQPRGAWIW